jgi:hypothetical protein
MLRVTFPTRTPIIFVNMLERACRNIPVHVCDENVCTIVDNVHIPIGAASSYMEDDVLCFNIAIETTVPWLSEPVLSLSPAPARIADVVKSCVYQVAARFRQIHDTIPDDPTASSITFDPSVITVDDYAMLIAVVYMYPVQQVSLSSHAVPDAYNKRIINTLKQLPIARRFPEDTFTVHRPSGIQNARLTVADFAPYLTPHVRDSALNDIGPWGEYGTAITIPLVDKPFAPYSSCIFETKDGLIVATSQSYEPTTTLLRAAFLHAERLFLDLKILSKS